MNKNIAVSEEYHAYLVEIQKRPSDGSRKTPLGKIVEDAIDLQYGKPSCQATNPG
ncbi:MAG: hypothetical protein KAS32_08635 [Candidatus Peribacteraceae bacterium]|nr:hypothetical protein [Candidatus Peribacteraceae bacterium]